MRKFLIILFLTFLVSAAAAVTIPEPTVPFGAYAGFHNPGTIKASDLYATDDAKVGDDLQVVGDLAVTGALSYGSGNFSSGTYDDDLRLLANHSFYSTTGSGAIDWSNATGIWKMPTGQGTVGAIDITGAIEADSTAKFGGAVTGASVVSNTTASAADLVASDDIEAADDVRVNGALYTGEVARVYQVISNTTGSFIGGIMGDSYAYIGGALRGASIRSNTSLSVGTNADIDGTLQVKSATDIQDLDVNATVDIDGATKIGGAVSTNDLTVNSTKTLAVTTSDKLTVGGVIVPQEVSLVVPIAASSVDQYCFIADAAYNITGIREIHAVAGNDASPVNVTVRICDDTEAPASGLNVSTAVLSLKSSAATLQSATLNSSNVAVAANDMVALDFTGTLTTLAGGCVQIDMKRV